MGKRVHPGLGEENRMKLIDADAAIDELNDEYHGTISDESMKIYQIIKWLNELPSVQPERKTGHWILNRSGAYCCSKCMEPCAGYVMMKPRDKFCKMCGSRNEVME